jgi:hypothetical protein
MRKLLPLALLALLLAVSQSKRVTPLPDEFFQVVSLEEELGMTLPCYISSCKRCSLAFECQECEDPGNCCSAHCALCSNDTCTHCKLDYSLKHNLCVP